MAPEEFIPRLTVADRKARLRIPPQHVTKQAPYARIHNWDEVYHGYTPEPAMFEAQRCIQCPAAPCTRACPVNNDIPGALALLEVGQFAEAAAVFRRTSNLPELCGRLCPQESLCEGSCVVGKNAKPVAIGKLEAFICDWDRAHHGGFPVPQPDHESGLAVAVVGSGPAGLVVAEQLRPLGHAVTVFEAWPLPGGLLRYGIPNFKSKKAIVDEKIAALEQAGVLFRCGVRLGRDLSWDNLRSFDAVFLGHGAGLGKKLAPGRRESRPRLHRHRVPGAGQSAGPGAAGRDPRAAVLGAAGGGDRRGRYLHGLRPLRRPLGRRPGDVALSPHGGGDAGAGRGAPPRQRRGRAR